MATRVTKFAKGVNRGTAVCSDCGKRTWKSRSHDMGGDFVLCDSCFDDAGMENEHSDTGGNHNGRGPIPAECPACREAAKVGPIVPTISPDTRFDVYVWMQSQDDFVIEQRGLTANQADILIMDLQQRKWQTDVRVAK